MLCHVELTVVVVVDRQPADKSILHDVLSELLQPSAFVQLRFSAARTAQFELCN